MSQKVISGEAGSYDEAEQQVDEQTEKEKKEKARTNLLEALKMLDIPHLINVRYYLFRSGDPEAKIIAATLFTCDISFTVRLGRDLEPYQGVNDDINHKKHGAKYGLLQQTSHISEEYAANYGVEMDGYLDPESRRIAREAVLVTATLKEEDKLFDQAAHYYAAIGETNKAEEMLRYPPVPDRDSMRIDRSAQLLDNAIRKFLVETSDYHMLLADQKSEIIEKAKEGIKELLKKYE